MRPAEIYKDRLDKFRTSPSRRSSKTQAWYSPNLDNPSVVIRIVESIDWIILNLHGQVSCSRIKLNNVFGSATPLGRWLRQFIVCTDSKFSQNVVSMKWKADRSKINVLLSDPRLYSTDATKGLQQVVLRESEKYREEIISGDFNYTTKSDRYWHPLQRLARSHKTWLFSNSGYCYNYDIRNACYSILYGEYLKKLPDVHERLLEIEKCLHGSTYRDRYRQEYGMSDSCVKTLLIGLLAGGKLTKFGYLGYLDSETLKRLDTDLGIILLRKDVARLWKTLEVGDTAVLKWRYYFSLERKVLDSVVNKLVETSNRHFLEHDGWRTTNPVNLVLLKSHILKHTGLNLNIILDTGGLE